ncbi:alpha/beta fold hydrolase [Croceicoccus sp. YJ47]|uniref:alpha/beta fold hydrolase n=1 Tax=Croceicoccus sp. YJ47 TaxID=2798724 RepID=UPI001923FDC0|nr:alpha/beta hydrolase [Croceicoccus sp. YJ47]QQN74784.1 alpha/beta hydrolase [Croceicoccus sp. YJ47]
MTSSPDPVRRQIPAHAHEARWSAPDGFRLRRIDFDHGSGVAAPRGSLLFLPGRGDSYEKYLETLARWHQAGWRVTAVDWRGQAGSGRLGDDRVTGHVDHFGLWVDDLADFWTQWMEQGVGPRVVVGHSMGGHLALRAMAEGRIAPDVAVLVAPMLGLAGKQMPAVITDAAARAMRWIRGATTPAWRWSEKPGELPQDRIDLLTHDESRYADEVWWRSERPELAMGPGSWGWVAGAIGSMRWLARETVLRRVAAPVMFVATGADRLVSADAIRRANRLIPDSRLVEFGPDCAHEILRETDAIRDRALLAIDDFLDEAAPPAS